MNLYELSSGYQRLLDLLESVDVTSDQEYAKTLQDTLDSLNDAFEDKAEGYVRIANQLNHDIKMVKEEISRLNEKEVALVNNLTKLKNILATEMDQTGKTKIKTPSFTIWVQNNPQSLQINNEWSIPKQFYIEQAPKLDRSGLLKHLKSTDETIDGVEITQTRGLRFK